MTQHADFGNKLGAIKEYNKLKQRIVDKIDHTTKGESLNKPNEKILALADKLLKLQKEEKRTENVREAKDEADLV